MSVKVRMFRTIVISYIKFRVTGYFFPQDWYDDVKAFSEQHDYDGLVVLLSISAEHRPPDQLVAVYSNNTDLLNQVPI